MDPSDIRKSDPGRWTSDWALATSSTIASLAVFVVAFDVVAATSGASGVLLVPLLLVVELLAWPLRWGLRRASGAAPTSRGGGWRRAAWVAFFIVTALGCAPVGALALPHLLLAVFLVTRTVQRPRDEWIPVALFLVTLGIGVLRDPAMLLDSPVAWRGLAAALATLANGAFHLAVLWGRRRSPG